MHSLLAALAARPEANGEVRPSEQDLAHATTAYHRRYLVPERDFQGEYRTTWQLTRQVADIIERSEVVRRGMIDSVQVTAVLPYHLRDIASRLALLSGAQQEQLKILRDLDQDDPLVSAILEPQRQALRLAIIDVTARVKAIEEFASLVVKADAAVRRKRALEELAKLNPSYEEILAQLGTGDNQLSSSGLVADEIRFVITEAGGDVRRANEAGRGLALPG